MKTRKQIYKARWGNAGRSAMGNISFTATDDDAAIREADKLALQYGLARYQRDVSRAGVVIEVRSGQS